MPSELAGPAFLSILLAAAALTAWLRRFHAPDGVRLLPAAAAATACQAIHVAEEFAGGFHLRAPELFGLEPWSAVFFISLNLVWLAIWSLALGRLGRGRLHLLSAILFWFLALASVGNGIWHPFACLITGSYFPGLVTSLLALPLGLWLIRKLIEPASAASAASAG